MTAEWQERAQCRDMEPGVFQADEPEYDEAAALAACASCVVREACLTTTLEAEGTAGVKQRFGIFGGMLPGDRSRLERRVRRGGNANPSSHWADRLTDEEHMARRQWCADGLNDVQIGRLHNVAAATIQRWRQRYGIPANIPPANDQTMRERARLADLGYSNREIAENEGCHVDAIRAWRQRRDRRSA